MAKTADKWSRNQLEDITQFVHFTNAKEPVFVDILYNVKNMQDLWNNQKSKKYYRLTVFQIS